MGRLYELATGLRELTDAWDDVLAGDRADGVLAAGVERFDKDAGERLEGLQRSLADGSYRPGHLTRIEMARDDGRTRLLMVPTVADRIVERAILKVLTPIIDPLLGPCSYAYRPGLGVADAIQAAALLRDEGMIWVAHTDINDCFPSLSAASLRRKLDVLVADDELRGLLDQLLARRSTGTGGLRAVRGLPQGSPLSPLWSNLLLAEFDEFVCRRGFPLVRYADDMLLFASTSDDAWEAMRVANEAAAQLKVELGADKSQVMSFDEGFCFLGEDFGPKYPPVLSTHRETAVQRKVMYLGLQGSRVRIEQGRLIVESPNDQELLDVPTGHVERLVCFGSVGVSAGVRSWALATDVELVFLSRRGSYLGQTIGSGSATRVARLRAQLAATENDDLRTHVGAAVVAAKVQKQIVVLQRLARQHNAEVVAEATDTMRQMLAMVPDATDRDGLMGLEGASARAYLGAVMPEGLGFEGRSRQPPLDVVNASLSYLYAVLLGEATSALVAVGLDPAIGLLHADHERRPSLALDLMEEFRPLVVDQVVVSASLRGHLRPEHGRREESVAGVLLSRAGKTVVLDAYERRMLQGTKGALPGFVGSLRRHLYRQAERLAGVILRPGEQWTGLSWRP